MAVVIIASNDNHGAKMADVTAGGYKDERHDKQVHNAATTY